MMLLMMIVMTSTWRPSKKLSPMMMTVLPPVVQPSLGEMALMQGMAAVGYRPGYSAATIVTYDQFHAICDVLRL